MSNVRFLMFDNQNMLSKTSGYMWYFHYLTVVAIYYSGAAYLDFKKKFLVETERHVSDIFTWGASFLLWMFMLIEFKDFGVSISWTIMGFVLLMVGLFLKSKALRHQGLLIFVISIFKVFIYDTANLESIYRTISFIALGVILLTASFLYTKYRDRLKDIL